MSSRSLEGPALADTLYGRWRESDPASQLSFPGEDSFWKSVLGATDTE